MPQVFKQKGYSFYFYSSDLNEPMHIHISRDGKEAKLWINTMSFAQEGRFTKSELNEIERIARGRVNEIIRAWNYHQSRR